MNSVEDEDKLVKSTSDPACSPDKLYGDDSTEAVGTTGTCIKVQNNESETPKSSFSVEKLATLVPYNDRNGDSKFLDSNNTGGESKIRTNGETELISGQELNEEEDISDIKETVPAQINLSPEQLAYFSKEDLVSKWTSQDQFISFFLSKFKMCQIEVDELKKQQYSDDKLKIQLQELQRKEQYHIMRLATKEHDIHELGAQVDELKSLAAGGGSLKHSLLDPAVNLLFERMKKDFDIAKAKMEETQNELAAWKFTPDSNTGKQLMAKCRLLIKENEELGKMISSGRLSKLEGDLTLQRSFSDELKKSQSELEEFLQEMDEDTEGMQGTILYLQSQLRQAKEKICQLSNQLNLGGPTSNNNTPASIREFEGGSFSSEINDPQNEQQDSPLPEEGTSGSHSTRTLIKKERCTTPPGENTSTTQNISSNGSEYLRGENNTSTNLSEHSQCSSDNTVISKNLTSSERKRTLSEDENASNTTSNKRTRNAEPNSVLENGISLS